MKAPPNKTVVSGWLRKFRPAADGHGGEMEIEVIENRSPDAAADHLRPEVGKPLRAFYAQPEPPADALPLGKRVRVELTLLSGPFGGRAVVQQLHAE